MRKEEGGRRRDEGGWREEGASRKTKFFQEITKFQSGWVSRSRALYLHVGLDLRLDFYFRIFHEHGF
jgi:hypothetical protein